MLERVVAERSHDHVLVRVGRAADALKGLAHGVGALEAQGNAAIRACEQIMPDAAGQLPDVLGLGLADDRSFGVAAGVDQRRRAVAGRRGGAGAIGMLPSGIDVALGARPWMAADPEEP